MENSLYSRIVMLGAAPETRDGMASVLQTYRACGLFGRWPVEFLTTRIEGGLKARALVVAQALRALAFLLVRDRRLAIHVHTAADASAWTDAIFMLVALAVRCPLIVQLHGGGFERLYDRCGSPGRALIQFVLDRAATVIVPTGVLRHWVVGISRTPGVRLIPSPVCAPSAKPAGERQKLVLFLGDMEESRGIFDLLEALATVRSAMPEARLVCAGDGDRGAVARYAERLGIAEAVKFTGWLGPSGKRSLLESVSAFVLPSYSGGLPMSLLEAMAAGVPVVASPTGAIPEAVVDGVTGFLVAPGDTATLARLIQKLLSDRVLAQRIGGAARESVRLRFSPERIVPRLEDMYAALGVARLDSGPRGTPRADLREAA